ncbi:hypothetical protein NMY22_g5932 [Coprinellus aureogranulatus]|nr:hypothetical protein NMY22_g5932 [Coprinellus aureogranulatus]
MDSHSNAPADTPPCPRDPTQTGSAKVLEDTQPLATVEDSLKIIEGELDSRWAERKEEVKNRDLTMDAYMRHFKNYQTWWAADQARRVQSAETKGQTYIAIPALPITGSKAALWLDHEARRAKKGNDGKVIPNTTLHFRTVSQMINALEYFRRTCQREPLYVSCDASKVKLRDHADIGAIETAAKRNEAKRQEQTQDTKANGLRSQTFTREELRKVCVGFLTEPADKRSELLLALRDHAMLVISTSMAMRGDNVRPICWSDISTEQVPLPNMGDDVYAQALVIVTNQGKTNVNGRLDPHGAFRHRLPELCAVGALARHFFGQFHIDKGNVGSFEPDYSHPEATDIGRREWYKWLVFPGGKSKTEPMSAQAHRKRFNKFKIDHDIHCKKATHGPRIRAADDALGFGAPEEETKAVGGWGSSGSFRQCYARALPAGGMLALAYYNGDRRTGYFLGRSVLEPPKHLVSQLFPWIESEEQKLADRMQRLGPQVARDIALSNFLETLKWFRVVLLQDVAVLSHKHPNMGILKHAPFNSQAFREFAQSAGPIVQKAEEDARHALKNMPEDYTQSVIGLMETTQIRQDTAFSELQRSHDALLAEVVMMREDMSQLVKPQGSRSSRKRKCANEPELGTCSPVLSQCVQRDTDTGLFEMVAERCRPSPYTPSVYGTRADGAEAPASTSVSGTTQGVLASTSLASVMSSSAVVLDTSEIHMQDGSDDSSSHSQFVSGNGNVYSTQTFPLDDESETRVVQMKAVLDIESKLSPERIRLQTFEWRLRTKRGKAWEWIPVIESMWKPDDGRHPTFEEIWQEHSTGIGNRLSTRELDQHWESRWKRPGGPDGGAVKTEYMRRMKVVQLITSLSQQAGWSVESALSFLTERCTPSPKRATESGISFLRSYRSLIEHLQKNKDGIATILEMSSAYLDSEALSGTDSSE